MSLLYSRNETLFFLCHSNFVETVYHTILPGSDKQTAPILNIFDIKFAFMKSNQKFVRKRKRDDIINHSEVSSIKRAYETLSTCLIKEGVFHSVDKGEDILNNNARKASDFYFKSILPMDYCHGGVVNDSIVITKINGQDYVLPPNCMFHCCDIKDLETKLVNETFDFILIDPPWVNRFVKRRKKMTPHHGYCMLTDEDLLKCNFRSLLNYKGLIAVWTTNSPSHTAFIKEKFFPSCGVDYIATWFWIKVTKTGELVCPFSDGTGTKQPFERLMFGAKSRQGTELKDGAVFMSVPSAIHSHKPPLTDLMKKYLKKDAKCLEVFARYLIPGWTSCGDQVLSMQLLSLYQPVK